MLAATLHCTHIDADEICRDLLEPQKEGWQAIKRVFGSRYLTGNGYIDRPLLRQSLFADDKIRLQVNELIHPLVKRTIVAKMAGIIGASEDSRVLVEVPLLFEVEWENLFDAVVVVYADNETCIRRLMYRDGVARSVAVTELASQLSLSEKVMRGNYVIDNSGMLPDTTNQVMHLADIIKNNGQDKEKKLDSKK